MEGEAMKESPKARAGANDFHTAIEEAHVVALWEMFDGEGGPEHLRGGLSPWLQRLGELLQV